MKNYIITKVAGWVGLFFVSIVIFLGLFTQGYILETVSLVYALLFAYGKFNNKLILQIMTGIFIIVYLFINFSLPDLLIWVAIAFDVFREIEKP